MPNWSDAFLGTLTSDYAAAGSYSWRVVYLGTLLSNTGKDYVRLTFQSALTEGLAINPVYIGARATAGDTYDFAVAPTQITFNGGSAGFAIGTNAQATSDVINYSIPTGTSGVIISFYAPDVNNNGFRRGTIGDAYYKAGLDVTTQNATGYGALAAYNLSLLKMEAGVDAGGFMPILVVAD